MNIQQERHYIHGDQKEGDPSCYYCSACDAFFQEEHFFGGRCDCGDHYGRYESALKVVGKSRKASREFGRPLDAANLFA